MVKILIYDIAQINFYNYLKEVLLEFSKRNVEVILAFEEKTKDPAAKNFLENFKQNRVGVFNPINKLINSDINLIIVNAQRIPDSLVVLLGNQSQIPVVMIQHGMYNGFLKRETDFFVKKIFKTLKYLHYAFKIGRISGKGGAYTLIRFYQAFARNKSYKKLFNYSDGIYASCVHVYGEYWKRYHMDYFGYKNSVFKTVGYSKLNWNPTSQEEKFHFCYIAQTLVEDGRLSINDLDRTLLILNSLNEKGYKVAIKRHPRSDNSIYENAGLKVIDRLPNSEVFIGHYSSLLAVPIAKKFKVAAIELEGHRIPDYFLQSMEIIKHSQELIDLLNKKDRKASSIEGVFEMPIGPKEHVDLLLGEIISI